MADLQFLTPETYQ